MKYLFEFMWKVQAFWWRLNTNVNIQELARLLTFSLWSQEYFLHAFQSTWNWVHTTHQWMQKCSVRMSLPFGWLKITSTCSIREEGVCVLLSVAAVNKAERLKSYTYVYWHNDCKRRDTRGHARIFWNCSLTSKKQEVTHLNHWLVLILWRRHEFFVVKSWLIRGINIIKLI